MAKIDQHPSVYLEEYRKYVNWLLSGALLQVIWAITIFYYSARPPEYFKEASHPYYMPGLLYSAYSALQAGWILICLLMGWFLASRGWTRAAALTSMFPGLGFLFGIFQVPLGWLVFRALAAEHWRSFFDWRERAGSMNRLTSRDP